MLRRHELVIVRFRDEWTRVNPRNVCSALNSCRTRCADGQLRLRATSRLMNCTMEGTPLTYQRYVWSRIERRPGGGYSLRVNVDRQNGYPLAMMSERRQLKHQVASTA